MTSEERILDHAWPAPAPGGSRRPAPPVRFSVPEGTTRIGDSAFAGCTALRSVSIPASVTAIDLSPGDPLHALPCFPFRGCGRLAAIRVAAGNPAFASRGGALFTKDFSALLCAPGPEKRSFRIPARTTAIAATAFDNCAALEAFEVARGSASFSVRDGLLFSKDGRTLVRVPPARTAPLAFGDGLDAVVAGAFRGCRLTGLSFEYYPHLLALPEEPGDFHGGCAPVPLDDLLVELSHACHALASVTLAGARYDLSGASAQARPGGK